MSPSAGSLVRWGIGLGVATAATTAGVVTDRVVSRRRADALETGESLVAEASEELVVLADDGVPLHVEIDEPTPESETTRDGRPLPTVVLSHGYCLTSQCWVFQRRALTAAGYRVVVWDQRGHGRSEKGDPASYTIEQIGRDLLAVIRDTAPEGDLFLAGHSMGGMTILSLAEEKPQLIRERVIAVAFIATSAGGMPLASGDLAASVGRMVLERLGPRTAAVLADRPDLVRTILKANRDLALALVERYSFASPVPRSVVRLASSMLLGTDLRVMSSFTPAFETYDRKATLRAFVGVETLVFNGEKDILTPPAHSDAIVEGIPGAEHLVLRDAGHVIMLEHPDVLSRQLIALGERAVRAQADDVDVDRKPRTRRILTNLDKRRRIERAKEQRKEKRGSGRRQKAENA